MLTLAPGPLKTASFCKLHRTLPGDRISAYILQDQEVLLTRDDEEL